MPRLYYLLIPIILLSSIAVNAQQAIITDRPDQTESAVSVPIGCFQIETGAAFSESDEEKSWALNTTLFRYGVVRNLELRLESGIDYSLNTKEANQVNMATTKAGLKYAPVKGKVELGYLLSVAFPEGTEQGESKTPAAFEVSNMLLWSHQVGNKLNFGYNLGHSYNFESEAHNMPFTFAIGATLNSKFGFFTEIYGAWDFEEEVGLAYDNGLTYLANDNLQFDFSFGTGINTKMNLWSFGLSWKVDS
jgi:hypothetical protein